MKIPKILVGCPTASTHGYCLKEYANAVKSLTYPNYEVLLVDNSKDDSYFKRIKSLGLNAIKDEYFEKARERICLLYTSPSPRDLSTSRMPSSA